MLRARNPLRGWVISDLHLFALRSVGDECFRAIRPQLAGADILVLNGDIFDLRWSTLPSMEATTVRAIEWIRELLAAFPNCETHYVLGNHDCPTFFAARLTELTHHFSHFHTHAYGVRIGPAFFVHGDCAHRRMDAHALRRYRADWDNDRQLSVTRARAYAAIDRIGITQWAHQCWFPRRVAVERLMHYLDHASPGWRAETRECYFGHTHLPFSDHAEGGLMFHNTGSGIRGMGFNPRSFSVGENIVVTLNGRAEEVGHP